MRRWQAFPPGSGYGAWLASDTLAAAKAAAQVLEKERQGTSEAIQPLWLEQAFKAQAQWQQLGGKWLEQVIAVGAGAGQQLASTLAELVDGLAELLDARLQVTEVEGEPEALPHGILLGVLSEAPLLHKLLGDAGVQQTLPAEGYAIYASREKGLLVIAGADKAGVLYGVYHLLRLIKRHALPDELLITEQPAQPLRMINQWDNMDGSIERGYAGKSIFYEQGAVAQDLDRVRDYARLLASVGINALAVNNVNVHQVETRLLEPEGLAELARMAEVLRPYHVRLFLSINFASPIALGGLTTADPLDEGVRAWWRAKAADLYAAIPDFGGFLVKADSENRPGPFTYGRNHADGANMLASALAPHGGIVIWRCFVYNCHQDWRDRKTDRARAAFDHFQPLDGDFLANVVLQVKNGPMDFQVREPVSPLLGAMKQTQLLVEFQITQEYTGQQRHLCFLVPQWKEVLDFDTTGSSADGEAGDSLAVPVKRLVDSSDPGRRHTGFAAVSNIGNDANWTGHLLAQANLYGFGRLAWQPDLSAETIAAEWAELTFGQGAHIAVIVNMLLQSWSVYESYTAPLGVGWMVNPEHHYGPNVDGYEYDKWGTYHFADCWGIGVDRTCATGTGYTGQYQGRNRERYESLADCPDELLLFFHHVPYTHRLHSGKTVIQHIYDTHFAGAEQAAAFCADWEKLASSVDPDLHAQVARRLEEQAAHACQWRDRINTYFYRKSGIADERGRTIY